MRDVYKSNSDAPKNQAAASMKVFPVPDPRRCNSLVTGYWLLVTGYWLLVEVCGHKFFAAIISIKWIVTGRSTLHRVTFTVQRAFENLA
jgi:hypothetical protein